MSHIIGDSVNDLFRQLMLFLSVLIFELGSKLNYLLRKTDYLVIWLTVTIYNKIPQSTCSYFANQWRLQYKYFLKSKTRFYKTTISFGFYLLFSG